MPRRQVLKELWAEPLARPMAHKLWAKPEPGAQPIQEFRGDGEAEPRLTSGGEAVAKGVQAVKGVQGVTLVRRH